MKAYKIFLSYITILSAVSTSCSSHRIKPDSDLTLDWLNNSKITLNDKISKQAAQEFINSFFDLFSQVVFDPNYRASEIENIQHTITKDIQQTEEQSRAGLIQLLNKRIKSINFSHLAVLDPQKTEKI